MAQAAETILRGAPDRHCGKKLQFEVLQTSAGYYIGTFCHKCHSPYSRETDYFKLRSEAEQALRMWHEMRVMPRRR